MGLEKKEEKVQEALGLLSVDYYLMKMGAIKTSCGKLWNFPKNEFNKFPRLVNIKDVESLINLIRRVNRIYVPGMNFKIITNERIAELIFKQVKHFGR